MAKKNSLIELIDIEGNSWGYAELSPSKIIKLVKAYKAAGVSVIPCESNQLLKIGK